MKCSGLGKVEANIDLMVQLEKDLKLPSITFLNKKRNLSLMKL